jgi:acyl dehydratase
MTGREPKIGDAASVNHMFSQQDLVAYAALTGDANPVHLDDGAAIAAGFAGTIVHGMLVAGLISRVLGTQLPGPGTIYLSQDLSFKRPIRPGMPLSVKVEVTGQKGEKPIFELTTTVENEEGVAVSGTATVLLRTHLE